MSRWRRVAIEQLPGLHKTIAAADGPCGLMSRLHLLSNGSFDQARATGSGAKPMHIEITDSRAHLFIEVSVPTHSGDDYWVWVATHIRAEMPGFQAAFSNELTLWELQGFYRDLKRLHAELKGTARLRAMEGFLDVTAEMDTQGHIRWAVELADTSSGNYTRLTFEMNADQSYLPALLEQLEAALQDMPTQDNR